MKIMKKFSVVFGLALAMLTVSCATDTTQDVALNETVFGVNVAEDSRIDLGTDGKSILWSDGDQISVNGIASKPIHAGVGTKVGNFSIQGTTDAPYTVFFPASVVVENGNIELPSNHIYKEGSFAKNAAIMYGTSSTTSISLKHLLGYVKFTITSGDNAMENSEVTDLALITNGGEPVSGTMRFENGTLTPVVGRDIVRAYAEEGFLTDYNNGKIETSIILPIPAGTYASGISLRVTSHDGVSTLSQTFTTSKSLTIAAGDIVSLSSQDLCNQVSSKVIATPSDLVSFLNDLEAGAANSWGAEVTVVADLDLNGITLPTVTKDFTGVFNGQGYSIKNWTSSTGLFASNSGTIKNIVLDESCVLTFPSPTTETGAIAIGFIVNNNTGLVQGCSNNADITCSPDVTAAQLKGAALVGYSSTANGRVHQCVNNGNINVTIATDNFASSTYLAGVVANTYGSGSNVCLEECINNGAVTLNITGIEGCASNVYVGGVTGASNSAGVVKDCINNADLTYNYVNGGTGSYTNMAGISGYSAAKIQNCTNYGDIKFVTKNVSRPAVAGVVGFMSKDISGCKNYGNIYAEGVKFGKAGMTSSGANPSGSGNQLNVSCGGVAATVGTTSLGTDTSLISRNISNCENHGSVTFKNPEANSAFGVAGVVGDFNGNISGCKNSGAITVVSGPHQAYVGGCIGRHTIGDDTGDTQTITGCSNSGAIHLSNDGGGATAYAGGVSGHSNGTITNCHNTGAITATNNVLVATGGVMGRYIGSMTNCTNKGVVKNDNIGAKDGSVGGVVGYSKGTLTDCHNEAAVTNVNATGHSYVGGVTGRNTLGTVTSCTNSGAITSTSDGSKPDVGGIIGYLKGEITDCENKATGNVSCKKGGTQCYVGGVVGRIAEDAVDLIISGCINRAAVTLDAIVNAASARSYVGGINGSYSNTSTMKNSTNYGAITSNAAAPMFVGGISGAWNGEMNNCENNGTVTMNKAVVGTNSDIAAVGGLIGYGNVKLVTNCRSYGAVKNSSAANTGTGGIVGDLGGGSATAPQTIQSVTINSQITSASGTIVGLYVGKINAAATYYNFGTSSAPIIVKTTTKINGSSLSASKVKALATVAPEFSTTTVPNTIYANYQ